MSVRRAGRVTTAGMLRACTAALALPILITACRSNPVNPDVGPGTTPTSVAGQPIPATAPQPNRALTPGALNSNVTVATIHQTICVSGWTSTIRPPLAYTEKLKASGIKAYGYTDKSLAHYEEDHDVPLELGGAPMDPTNLWPEPHTPTIGGAFTKDALENYLHHHVCAKAPDVTLQAAQAAFLGDWFAAWNRYGRPMPSIHPPFYTGGNKINP